MLKRFFKGLFTITAEIIIGGLWAFAIIGVAFLCLVLFVALVTWPMR